MQNVLKRKYITIKRFFTPSLSGCTNKNHFSALPFDTKKWEQSRSRFHYKGQLFLHFSFSPIARGTAKSVWKKITNLFPENTKTNCACYKNVRCDDFFTGSIYWEEFQGDRRKGVKNSFLGVRLALGCVEIWNWETYMINY